SNRRTSRRHRSSASKSARKASVNVRALVPRFARAIAIDDAALRQVVRRHLEIDAVARQYLDAVTAQASGDVRQDRHAVLEFHRERRARENLAYGAVDFESFLFGRHRGGVRSVCFGTVAT